MSYRTAAFARALREPVLMITIGILFAIQQAGILPFTRTWPLILIMIGLMKLIERMLSPHEPPPPQAPYGRHAAVMSMQRTIAGPVILIAIGVVFLIHAISPDFSVGRIAADYWPYVIIAWGGILVLEIFVRYLMGAPLPTRMVSGGTWFAVFAICSAGLITHAVWSPDNWWHRFGFHEGVQMFGQAHDYPIAPVHKDAGATPHVVIEAFHGSAKIVGGDGNEISVTGHKTIRSFNERDAREADAATPVTVTVSGSDVVIRCNQPGRARTPVTTSLEISLPRAANLQASEFDGDFEVSSLSGGVQITARGGTVRADDLGSFTAETHHTDLIHCTGVKGPAAVRGDGEDIEMEDIGGPVTVAGHYPGTVQLRHLAQSVSISDFRTNFTAQKISGELRLDGGELSGQGVSGPVKLAAHATDVNLSSFTGPLELEIDRGDISLAPGELPLSGMNVRTRSGDIVLVLPTAATFSISALAAAGGIQNEFSDVLQTHNQGRVTRMEGSVGSGPRLTLLTGLGDVTVRKTEAPAEVPADAGTASEKVVLYTR
jgi:DUF4097 and DUF4098 domain-containing protein YvlB